MQVLVEAQDTNTWREPLTILKILTMGKLPEPGELIICPGSGLPTDARAKEVTPPRGNRKARIRVLLQRPYLDHMLASHGWQRP